MKPPATASYLRTKVLTASPAELRLMLIDGAIRFAEQARTGLESKNYEACYNGITRTQAILLELINGLRPEVDPELCDRLSALYTYMYTQLMKAGSERQISMIDEVLNLLNFERQTWTMLLEQLSKENVSASAIDDVPNGAAPLLPPGPHSPASPIVGARVSVRG